MVSGECRGAIYSVLPRAMKTKELRTDVITGRSVYMETDERAMKRSSDYEGGLSQSGNPFCPFCEGNESETPPEIYAKRLEGSERDGKGWSIRVVPNKYPVLTPEFGEESRGGEGIYKRIGGFGAHEVIIDVARHERSAGNLSETELFDLLATFRLRINELKKEPRLKYVLIFKNQGKWAGATVEHIHTQLVALPIVPQAIKEELSAAERFYGERSKCVYCERLGKELKRSVRLVAKNADFALFAPYVSRTPFELVVTPLKHSECFEASSDKELEALAEIMGEALSKVKGLLGDPSLNMVLLNSPLHEPTGDYFHWRIEIIPKILTLSALPIGGGVYFNPTPPEVAAEEFRNKG
ncbi:MAG: galactose-1-phosphate uridylyltransferase [Myxococcota bacterium]